MVTEELFIDIECYWNYFLVQLKNSEGRYRHFERTENCELDVKTLKGLMNSYTTIGFNSLNYDLPMLTLALTGVDNEALKEASDKLIGGMKPWHFYKAFRLNQPTFDHIDIMEVTPGVMVSLKSYAGRIHMPKMQDLPYPPDTLLTLDKMYAVREYCQNDLDVTQALYERITDRVELRKAMSKQYDTDLRSKSDAQAAEAVLKKELFRITRMPLQRSEVKEKKFYYVAPDYLEFQTEQLQQVFDMVKTEPFTARTNNKIEMTDRLAKTLITIGQSKYQLGIGGLHSQENEQAIVADDVMAIHDLDFESYYPNIMLNNGYSPKHIGEEFLNVYRDIVKRRVDAKKKGKDDPHYKNIAESLKITINGTFGKLGSMYSAIYAPELMVQVTLTGQLTLLILIEQMEALGISIRSANTDGIVAHCPRSLEKQMKELVKRFEKLTNHVIEDTPYSAIYSRDVNNYIAIKTDGKVKTKGAFGVGDLGKNPQTDICNEAVIAYLKDGTPIVDTITGSADITKFVSIRTVKGGGIWKDEYVGKVVRWVYVSLDGAPITYRSSGNKVPKTDGCMPLMQLPVDFPVGIDYNWYVNEANDILMDLGVTKRPPVVKKTRSKK